MPETMIDEILEMSLPGQIRLFKTAFRVRRIWRRTLIYAVIPLIVIIVPVFLILHFLFGTVISLIILYTFICFSGVHNDKLYSYMIGIFVIFSVDWNSDYLVIFILGLSVLLVGINAVKSFKNEIEAITPIYYFQPSSKCNFEELYDFLNQKCPFETLNGEKEETRKDVLLSMNRGHYGLSIAYFCRRKLEMSSIKKAISIVELLRHNLNLEIEESNEIAFIIFLICEKKGIETSEYMRYISKLFETPLTSEEILAIVKLSREILIEEDENIDRFFTPIIDGANKGYSSESLVKCFRFVNAGGLIV